MKSASGLEAETGPLRRYKALKLSKFESTGVKFVKAGERETFDKNERLSKVSDSCA
jgi:hypothetical protein